MAVSILAYRPILFSELVEPNAVGQFDLCRAAALCMGIDACTLGEWTTQANGSKWGKGKIANALRRMRAETGEPLRASYNQGHMDDFLRGVNFPVDAYHKFNTTMARIKQALRDGWVVFLAGDVKHTRSRSPLRKYVNGNVGHQIILVGINKAGDMLGFIDPMTPHGTKRYVRWAPVNDFSRFGSEFREGTNYIAGRMKRGQYTQAKIVAKNRAAAILKLQTDLGNLQDLWRQQQRELIAQDVQLTTLSKQLAELEKDLATANRLLEECGTDDEVDALEVLLHGYEQRMGQIKALASVG